MPLPEWTTGIPECYNDFEHLAVITTKRDFKDEMDREAKRKGGTHFTFSPVIEKEIDGLLTEMALRKLALDSLNGPEEFAKNWRQSVSTYLKAWLAKSNPSVLLDIAEVLKAAECSELSRKCVDATVPFASFAKGRYEVDYTTAAMFIRGAFPGQYPYGDNIEEHMGNSGMFTPCRLDSLRQRAANI